MIPSENSESLGVVETPTGMSLNCNDQSGYETKGRDPTSASLA
jgi:hypothetical protein